MEKYQHVRFRWWNPVNLDKAKEELKGFKANVKQLPTGGFDLYKDDKLELSAASDTLVAHLSGFRAVLTQREAKPFTKRDVELREKVRGMYPQDRPTPFPWEWSPEPRFTVEE
ncbi:MAG TPA: hypothetical protein VGB32_04420 [Candidatus Bathyarchaeia archaeon]